MSLLLLPQVSLDSVASFLDGRDVWRINTRVCHTISVSWDRWVKASETHPYVSDCKTKGDSYNRFLILLSHHLRHTALHEKLISSHVPHSYWWIGETFTAALYEPFVLKFVQVSFETWRHLTHATFLRARRHVQDCTDCKTKRGRELLGERNVVFTCTSIERPEKRARLS